MITEIGLDYFRELPYSKPCNNYLLFLCAIFFFEHVTAIMSRNCAIYFHRYHFNKILVVFCCFGEILKILFVSRSFRDIHRSSEGNLGYYGGILGYSVVFLGKCMDRRWGGNWVYKGSVYRKQVFAQLPPEGTKPKYMIFSARNPVSKLDL